MAIAFWCRPREATATLTATRAKHGSKTGSLSSYIARREPGDGAIRATFGDLGAIAMRFRPSGAVTHSKPQKGCVGADRYTIHHGVFVGSLRFRGEGGYVSVKAHRVAGESRTPLSLDCGGSRAPGRALSADADGPPIFRFEAGFRSGTLAEFFYASEEGAHPAQFVASVEQTVGRLAIHRLALARGRPRSFAADDALSFATLAPTGPVRGNRLDDQRPHRRPALGRIADRELSRRPGRSADRAAVQDQAEPESVVARSHAQSAVVVYLA